MAQKSKCQLTFSVEQKLFSLFRIPYQNYVDIEFLFCFKLHIPPSELERMYWYDVMFLVQRYISHIEDENRRQEETDAKQQEEIDSYKNDYSSQVPNISSYNMPNFDNIGRGFE